MWSFLQYIGTLVVQVPLRMCCRYRYYNRGGLQVLIDKETAQQRSAWDAYKT